MTKSKNQVRKQGTHRKSGGKQSSIKQFVSFIFSPPVLIALLVIIVIGLLYWFLPGIINWSTVTWQKTIDLFGAGIIFIIVSLVTIISVLVQNKSSLFIKYWHRWVGAILLIFFLWGLLAFINRDLGGKIGQEIISESTPTGILRLSGLILLATLCIFPRQTLNFLYRIVKSIGRGISAVATLIAKSVSNSLKSSQKGKPKEVKQKKGKLLEIETSQVSTITGQTQESTTELGSPAKAESITYQPSMTIGGWQLPPVTILDKPSEPDITQTDVEKRAQLLEKALASYGVEAVVIDKNVGPTVTQFGVEPGWDRKYKEIKERDKDGNVKVKLQEISKTRVKVERISSLANDLALAMAAPSIRIEAPVPGTSVVGVEVPNVTFGSVNLRSIIESTTYQKISAKSKLAIPLGKGAGGEVVAADLTKMPHLLVAGATGSGKTVYLNSIICCLLFSNTPDDLNFIMIDPKRVELVNFNSLPHLSAPVVVDTDKAILALQWLVDEMDGRYKKFAQAGVRNIEGYNKNRAPGEGLPFIVLIIDELADLMMTAFGEVEHALVRLAQLASATGIHLIVATQRPSVDVITGLIKANFPTRISFSLTSQVDSRTILDSTGAEKLLGRGDMLYMPTDASKPKRLQGSFLSDAEIERLVKFWGNQRRTDIASINFENLIQKSIATTDIEDPLIEAARQLATQYTAISTSFLQRKLRIGYPRAARIMEKLKEEGF